ncbi:dihydropteroate synthase [Blattabacterium cuenoti]|uniref:dihydropteroate synthase n=1 Tax=Blattabacterium cuenoti TaxID=1653831 RepID=UPI00163D0E32|nr:dihydropteroate synthase [Blattabacterium cuenoti]
MGIVNLTPDSFYNGGRLKYEYHLLKHIEILLKEGADFIDIGGVSTRPGSHFIEKKEEIQRIQKPIQIIIKNFPNIKISIDTFRSEVAKIAIQEGAVMVNDISGGNFDKKMYSFLGRYHIPYVLNHIKGTPKNMQKKPYYHDDIIIEINRYFFYKISILKKYGVCDIILDPGFGFGKTLKHNIQLLKYLSLLGFQEHLILVGISRKSMIQNILNISQKESLNGSSIMHTIALLNRAKILRVHDVKEARECVKIIDYYHHI